MKFFRQVNFNKYSGQSLLEFALALPVFLLMLFGIMEVSREVFFYAAIFAASREAARYASASGFIPSSATVHYYQDCQWIYDQAKKIAVGTKLVISDVTISYDHGPGTTIPDNCPVGTALQTGDRVVVNVKKAYVSSILPILNQTFSSTSYRTVIADLNYSSTLAPTAAPWSFWSITYQKNSLWEKQKKYPPFSINKKVPAKV